MSLLSPPVTTGRRAGQPTHRTSHDHLLRRVPWTRERNNSAGRLDAIVVPAARSATSLRAALNLAVGTQTLLVVLASHRCDVAAVADLVAATPGSRALIAAVPEDHDPQLVRLSTAESRFRVLSAGRNSNLSLKRNLGLALARLRGWRKIMFLDDDILPPSPMMVRQVACHLESHRFAGFRVVRMPDNSVVCHANRVVGGSQGIFVSGAALGVNCSDLPLEVFPDVYNEDWFAMAGVAGGSGVVCVGDAWQADYNPFRDPSRAAHEEFGDLLAEGLFGALADGRNPTRAGYWGEFIDARRSFIKGIANGLDRIQAGEARQVEDSLAAAWGRLDMIQPEDCVDFLIARNIDRHTFQVATNRLPTGVPYPDALARLGLTDWRLAEFARADLPTAHLVG